MNSLADVDGFKICIQVCVWLGFPPLSLRGKLTNLVSLKQMQIKEMSIYRPEVWKMRLSSVHH